VQSSNHGEIRTSTAAAPCSCANDEEAADRHHVEQHDMLQRQRVRRLQREERAQEEDRRKPERCNQQYGTEDQHRSQHLGHARRQLAPRDRTRPLDGMLPVERRVAHVVDEVARAGRGAVRGKRGEGFAPTGEIAELRREDDPCEEEQVLRPLARTQRNEGRAGQRPSLRQVDDRRRNAHAGRG
jgi:hypothetical protein